MKSSGAMTKHVESKMSRQSGRDSGIGLVRSQANLGLGKSPICRLPSPYRARSGSGTAGITEARPNPAVNLDLASYASLQVAIPRLPGDFILGQTEVDDDDDDDDADERPA